MRLNKIKRRLADEINRFFFNNLTDAGERVDINIANKGVDYDLLDMYQKSHIKRYEYAKEKLFSGCSVGDFACGSGYGSVMLSEKSERVVGIDLNKRVIKIIQERYKRVSNVAFICGDLLNINYSSIFNIIVSFETIEHFLPENIGQLFDIFHEALKPNGLIIFSVPYMQKRTEQAIKMGFHQTFEIGEIEIRQWLNRSKFSLEAIMYQNYYTHVIEANLAKKDFVICIARVIK